jgi:hypothetical protein
MKQLDRGDLIRVLPLQEPVALELTGRGIEGLRQAAHFVRPDGAVFAGAAAGREAARYLRGGWLVRGITTVPGVMPLAERIYGLIARRWGPVP